MWRQSSRWHTPLRYSRRRPDVARGDGCGASAEVQSMAASKAGSRRVEIQSNLGSGGCHPRSAPSAALPVHALSPQQCVSPDRREPAAGLEPGRRRRCGRSARATGGSPGRHARAQGRGCRRDRQRPRVALGGGRASGGRLAAGAPPRLDRSLFARAVAQVGAISTACAWGISAAPVHAAPRVVRVFRHP